MSFGQILIFVVLCATCTLASTCPSDPPARQNLDVDRYLGKWFMQITGRAWHGQQDNIDCIAEEYTRRADNPLLLDIHWTARLDQVRWVNDTGLITTTSPNKWDFYMSGTVFHSTMVATDYENWTIEYSCIESNGVTKENYAIRSRGQSLSADVLATLKSVVEGFGVDPMEFVTIGQDCI